MKWQPIETAPKDGTRILVADKDWVWITHWHVFTVTSNRSTYLAHYGWMEGNPLHWKLLEEPPQ